MRRLTAGSRLGTRWRPKRRPPYMRPQVHCKSSAKPKLGAMTGLKSIKRFHWKRAQAHLAGYGGGFAARERDAVLQSSTYRMVSGLSLAGGLIDSGTNANGRQSWTGRLGEFGSSIARLAAMAATSARSNRNGCAGP